MSQDSGRLGLLSAYHWAPSWSWSWHGHRLGSIVVTCTYLFQRGVPVLRRAKAGSAEGASRKRVGVGILVAVMVVAPAAIAWACNPQAHVTLDQTSIAPGKTVTAYGSYFPGNVNISVSGPTGSETVKTSTGGSFAKQFTVPSKPGSYVISATRPTGGAASVAFRVAAPAAKAVPAPVQTDAPSAAAPRAPSFDSPSVVRSERQRSTSGGGGSDGGGPGAQTTPGNTGSGSGGGVVVSPSGAPVFVGSIPAAASTGTFAPAPAPAAAAGSRAARQSSATPSDQAASGYVWSGFAPGRTPSLSTAGDMVSEGDNGSGLGLGIGLLAFGLLALVAGLTAAEVSRRRAAA